MVMLPEVVGKYREGRMQAYNAAKSKMNAGILIVTIVIVAGMWMGVEPLFRLLGKGAYSAQIDVLWVLIVAMGIASVGLVPHYSLYAAGRDRAILISSGVGLAAAVLANILLIPQYGISGAAYGTLVGMAGIGITKGGYVLGESH